MINDGHILLRAIYQWGKVINKCDLSMMMICRWGWLMNNGEFIKDGDLSSERFIDKGDFTINVINTQLIMMIYWLRWLYDDD